MLGLNKRTSRLLFLSFIFILLILSLPMTYVIHYTQQYYQKNQRSSLTATTTHLAYHFSILKTAQDDLSALNLIKATQTMYPQLQSLMVVTEEGRIIWHTQPDKMGTQLAMPIIRHHEPATIDQQDDPSSIAVMAQLPNHENYYCYAKFSQRPFNQYQQAVLIRASIFIGLIGVGLALFMVLIMRPTQVNDSTSQPLPPIAASSLVFQLANQLVREQVKMVIDQHNHILAVSPSFLPTKGTQDVTHYQGQHLLQAGYSDALLQAVSRIAQQPDLPITAVINQIGHSDQITVTLTCYPAQAKWDYILVTC